MIYDKDDTCFALKNRHANCRTVYSRTKGTE